MKGWLVDARVGDEARLTFKLEDGSRMQLRDSFTPYFFLSSDDAEEAAFLVSQHPLVESAIVERKRVRISDLQERHVVRVFVPHASDLERVSLAVRRLHSHPECFETRVPQSFHYLADRNLNFFRKYEIAEGKKGPAFSPLESEGMPELRVAVAVRNENKANVFFDDGLKEKFDFEKDSLSPFLSSHSVDVFCTVGGDEWLRGAGVSRSGRGAFLSACTHVDVLADVHHDIYADAFDPRLLSLPRLFSLARERVLRLQELSLTCNVRPDLASRLTAGRLNTFLHYASARSRGVLIPDDKRITERPKTLAALKASDKGGLTLFPEPGVYEQVAKCDFASMYPSLIVSRNISPETLDCACCPDAPLVPETDWRLCTRRKGVIPQGIENVLSRRLELKRRMREAEDPEERRSFDVRQRALKNLLVTCFGYLGFNNFVFSNVECKECVMLYGREALARTKQIAEERGLRVLYGVVDSVFVAGGNEKDYHDFLQETSKEIGVRLELDKLFSRIVFPRAANGAGIANKYYGVTASGELEARGIALRRSDTPAIVSEFQEKAARMILRNPEKTSETDFLLSEYVGKIRDGHASPDSLSIMRSVRKPLEEYAVRPAHVRAFALAPNKEGVSRFVLTRRDPKPAHLALEGEADARAYAILLERALNELLW